MRAVEKEARARNKAQRASPNLQHDLALVSAQPEHQNAQESRKPSAKSGRAKAQGGDLKNASVAFARLCGCTRLSGRRVHGLLAVGRTVASTPQLLLAHARSLQVEQVRSVSVVSQAEAPAVARGLGSGANKRRRRQARSESGSETAPRAAYFVWPATV